MDINNTFIRVKDENLKSKFDAGISFGRNLLGKTAFKLGEKCQSFLSYFIKDDNVSTNKSILERSVNNISLVIVYDDYEDDPEDDIKEDLYYGSQFINYVFQNKSKFELKYNSLKQTNKITEPINSTELNSKIRFDQDKLDFSENSSTGTSMYNLNVLLKDHEVKRITSPRQSENSDSSENFTSFQKKYIFSVTHDYKRPKTFLEEKLGNEKSSALTPFNFSYPKNSKFDFTEKHRDLSAGYGHGNLCENRIQKCFSKNDNLNICENDHILDIKSRQQSQIPPNEYINKGILRNFILDIRRDKLLGQDEIYIFNFTYVLPSNNDSISTVSSTKANISLFVYNFIKYLTLEKNIGLTAICSRVSNLEMLMTDLCSHKNQLTRAQYFQLRQVNNELLSKQSQESTSTLKFSLNIQVSKRKTKFKKALFDSNKVPFFQTAYETELFGTSDILEYRCNSKSNCNFSVSHRNLCSFLVTTSENDKQYDADCSNEKEIVLRKNEISSHKNKDYQMCSNNFGRKWGSLSKDYVFFSKNEILINDDIVKNVVEYCKQYLEVNLFYPVINKRLRKSKYVFDVKNVFRQKRAYPYTDFDEYGKRTRFKKNPAYCNTFNSTRNLILSSASKSEQLTSPFYYKMMFNKEFRSKEEDTLGGINGVKIGNLGVKDVYEEKTIFIQSPETIILGQIKPCVVRLNKIENLPSFSSTNLTLFKEGNSKPYESTSSLKNITEYNFSADSSEEATESTGYFSLNECSGSEYFSTENDDKQDKKDMHKKTLESLQTAENSFSECMTPCKVILNKIDCTFPNLKCNSTVSKQNSFCSYNLRPCSRNKAENKRKNHSRENARQPTAYFNDINFYDFAKKGPTKKNTSYGTTESVDYDNNLESYTSFCDYLKKKISKSDKSRNNEENFQPKKHITVMRSDGEALTTAQTKSNPKIQKFLKTKCDGKLQNSSSNLNSKFSTKTKGKIKKKGKKLNEIEITDIRNQFRRKCQKSSQQLGKTKGRQIQKLESFFVVSSRSDTIYSYNDDFGFKHEQTVKQTFSKTYKTHQQQKWNCDNLCDQSNLFDGRENSKPFPDLSLSRRHINGVSTNDIKNMDMESFISLRQKIRKNTIENTYDSQEDCQNKKVTRHHKRALTFPETSTAVKRQKKCSNSGSETSKKSKLNDLLPKSRYTEYQNLLARKISQT